MRNTMLFGVVCAVLGALMLVVLVPGVSAGIAAVIDEATANGRCITSYPGAPSGPDPLSPCQWDMSVINAGAAQATVTGKGVKVGVIDGGVDFSHPDLSGAIDAARQELLRQQRRRYR